MLGRGGISIILCSRQRLTALFLLQGLLFSLLYFIAELRRSLSGGGRRSTRLVLIIRLFTGCELIIVL